MPRAHKSPEQSIKSVLKKKALTFAVSKAKDAKALPVKVKSPLPASERPIKLILPKDPQTRIEKLRLETELLLKKVGAFQTEYSNAKELQYGNRQLLSKSPMSIMLKTIGITAPHQLARSYVNCRDIRWFKLVYYMYVFRVLDGPQANVNFQGPTKMFKELEMPIPHLYGYYAKKYYNRRRELRVFMDLIAGKKLYDANALYKINQLQNQYDTILKSTESQEEILKSAHGGYSTAAMALLERDKFINLAALPWDKESDMLAADTAQYEIISCGWLRHKLPQVAKPVLGELTPRMRFDDFIDPATDKLVQSIWNASYQEMDANAKELRARTNDVLDLMYNWELLSGGDPILDNPATAFVVDSGDNNQTPDMQEIHTTGSLANSTVPAQVLDLANKLAAKHGPVTIAKESSGIQIYVANPKLLHTDGMKELQSKHIAVNAERYFGIGPYDSAIHPTKENQALYRKYYSKNKEVPCAMCMKTREIWSVANLLQYKPVKERDFKFSNVQPRVNVGAVNKRLVPDGKGNMIPEWCGDTVALSELPTNHPAVEYLTSRGYHIGLLEMHLGIRYCYNALPVSKSEGRYYSLLPGGMANSPQGRIIFPILMNGVAVGYQSRYIDKWVDNKYYFWSNEQKWEWIKTKHPDGSIELRFPPDERFTKGFDPHKYLNAVGSERNKLLMGFDAAIEYNAHRPAGKRYCVLAEGPLDAGRIGAPGIAILGKFLSPLQSAQLAAQFDTVLVVADNDKEGKRMAASVQDSLPTTKVVLISVPPNVKDLGDLTYTEAYALIDPHIPV